MKVKTLLIAVAILTVLASMTVANLAGQQQRASRPLPAAVQLTEAEEQHILYMREEEKLARDVYLTLYELWDAEIFANISESEQRHMDAIKNLITRYGLGDPVVDDAVGIFTNQDFETLYDELVADGSVSLEEALKVGVRIEELDIADLELVLQDTSMRTVKRVFQNLLNGSYNHLSAFRRNIETGGTECPSQLGLGDGTCSVDQDGGMMRRGNRRSGNRRGQGNGGFGSGRWNRNRQTDRFAPPQ
ncbi:MAG: DUF2202 domain-containing protein [Planctomycetes bacterium]|nr:DUF2202 domain-containing protein [Planctomycetota bacterium]